VLLGMILELRLGRAYSIDAPSTDAAASTGGNTCACSGLLVLPGMRNKPVKLVQMLLRMMLVQLVVQLLIQITLIRLLLHNSF